MFLIVGGTDIVLAWYPPSFGNPQWEFGTVSRTFDFLPLLTLGLALSLGAGVATGRRWVIVTVSALLLALAVLILIADVLYLTNVPIAMKAVTQPVPRLGLKRAIAKAAMQGTVYPLAFVWLGVQGFRRGMARK